MSERLVLAKQNKVNETYQTSNIDLAIYLVSVGKRLEKIEVCGRTGFFVFDKALVSDEVALFSSGDALVDPLHFSKSNRVVRERLREALEGGGRRV